MGRAGKKAYVKEGDRRHWLSCRVTRHCLPKLPCQLWPSQCRLPSLELLADRCINRRYEQSKLWPIHAPDPSSARLPSLVISCLSARTWHRSEWQEAPRVLRTRVSQDAAQRSGVSLTSVMFVRARVTMVTYWFFRYAISLFLYHWTYVVPDVQMPVISPSLSTLNFPCLRGPTEYGLRLSVRESRPASRRRIASRPCYPSWFFGLLSARYSLQAIGVYSLCEDADKPWCHREPSSSLVSKSNFMPAKIVGYEDPFLTRC